MIYFGKYIIKDKRYEEKSYIRSKENLNTLEYFDATDKDENSKTVYINKIDKKYIIDGVGIYNTVAVRDMLSRVNEYAYTKYNDIEIFGHIFSFTRSYVLDKISDNEKIGYFGEVIRGKGMNETAKYEGIKYNNFYATYILGPFLLLNPVFTKYIFSKIGYNEKIYLEDKLMNAYEKRKEEYKDENKKI